MSHYQHLTIEEREKILVLYTKNESLRSIAREIGRNVSTVSRELRRNTQGKKGYSAVEAQNKYRRRRKKCRRHKLLENPLLWETVNHLFLELQWSPEQIANRFVLEKRPFSIIYSTIYRAIYAGLFDTPAQRKSHGCRGAARKLRHRGKTRLGKGSIEKRGKMKVDFTIHERPLEADNREVVGHWEGDTVLGKTGSACLVTLADRRSRFLLAGKVANKDSLLVAEEIIALLRTVPRYKRKTITPDRGKEFSKYNLVTDLLQVPFYFSDPHAPWQRGTNENTNGLIREYLPKSFDIALCSDEELASYVEKLNTRPRKCLGWKTPYEVFYGDVLRLT